MDKQQALEKIALLENEVRELRKIIETPKQISPEERFEQLIQGWEYKVDLLKYPSSIFIFKGESCLFEYEFKNSDLWTNYVMIWSIFRDEFGYNYDEIQLFIESQVENHFNLKGVKPECGNAIGCGLVENHFNLKGVKPQLELSYESGRVENHFNLKGVKPLTTLAKSQ